MTATQRTTTASLILSLSLVAFGAALLTASMEPTPTQRPAKVAPALRLVELGPVDYANAFESKHY